MVITTSITQNYLAKAKVLLASVRQHHPEATFCLCLVERKEQVSAFEDLQGFDDVIYPEDLWGDQTEDTIFKYSVVEACTAIKGTLMRALMRRYGTHDEIVYLDPDTFVTAPLVELMVELKKSQIILTPHLLDTEFSVKAIWENEICSLRHGTFNLGFLAVSRGEESEAFLRWWEDRLNNYCFDDPNSGLFTDQKWMDLAPGFFEVKILKHRGYNVAPWNIGHRRITKAGGDIFAAGVPLRFFHFSGFNSGANLGMMKKYVSGDPRALFELRDNYARRLADAGEERLKRINWTFGNFRSGRKIAPSYRRAFRFYKWSDPFGRAHFISWLRVCFFVYFKSYAKRHLRFWAKRIWA